MRLVVYLLLLLLVVGATGALLYEAKVTFLGEEHSAGEGLNHGGEGAVHGTEATTGSQHATG